MSSMTVNVKSDDYDIDVYTHDIFYFADEFLESNIDNPKDRNELKENFDNLIFYIRHRIPKPDNNDLELLDNLFCNVFLELCMKWYVLPTLENFSLMFSINPNTISAWINGEYRKATPQYSLTAKKWQNICKTRLVNTLTQSKGGDINRIFIAKAAYGMAETAPAQIAPQPMQALNNEQLAARLGGRIEQHPDVIDDDG